MKLNYKNLLFGAFIGLGMLFGVIKFIPDNKLHLVFCNVGQGDATYIKFPNGTDMLVDGGPNNKVLECLGRHMAFYDRKIDLVFLTHPQSDHYTGLIEVAKRYKIKYFISSFDVSQFSSLKKISDLLTQQSTVLKNVSSGQSISVDAGIIKVLWPDTKWLALNYSANTNNVLGAQSEEKTNTLSLYLDINYGNFDALLTGDGDSAAQNEINIYRLASLIPADIDVLKVPHHGSKLSVSDAFLNQIKPALSIIEVGKNSYGHPNPETVNRLSQWGKVLRTDQDGEIEIISDGKSWQRVE